MDNQRLFLFFALALILMLLWQAWEQEQRPTPAITAPATPAGEVPRAPDVPAVKLVAPGAPAARADAFERGRRIKVVTDMFEAYVDTHGGDLREVNLRRYPVSADKPDKPFRLLADSSPDIFVAQSGLLGHEGHFPASPHAVPNRGNRLHAARRPERAARAAHLARRRRHAVHQDLCLPA